MQLDDVLGTCGHAKFTTFTGWLKEDLSRDEIKISREKFCDTGAALYQLS